jgi:hypothetical protein
MHNLFNNDFARVDFLTIQDPWIAVPPPQKTEGPGITVLHTSNGVRSVGSAMILCFLPNSSSLEQGLLTRFQRGDRIRIIYLPRAVHAACSDTSYEEVCLAENQTPVGSAWDFLPKCL